MPRTPALFAVSMLMLTASVTIAQDASQNPDAQTAQAITAPSPVRAIEHYDLQKKKDNLAIEGYDPVAYFKEGGGEARKGKKSITTTHKGVTYRFASEANRTLFLADPARYEPAYGGWCAWAMTSGDKTEIDPKTFIVRGGRLYLFYNGFFGNTKKDWLKGDHDELSQRADAQWKTITGESPRLTPQPSQESP